MSKIPIKYIAVCYVYFVFSYISGTSIASFTTSIGAPIIEFR